MQFLAQLPLRECEAVLHGDQYLLLFQCQSDPGMCDEWDAESGGNATRINHESTSITHTKIGILSKNCAWWIMSDLAIWMAGYVSVPLYPTLARVWSRAEASRS